MDFFEQAKRLGGPYPRFELAFFGAGEMIRNPFWEAMEEEAIRTGNEFQLARFLDRLTGIISTEAMGVSTTIRQLESSFVWFAPRYTRACLTVLEGDCPECEGEGYKECIECDPSAKVVSCERINIGEGCAIKCTCTNGKVSLYKLWERKVSCTHINTDI